MIEQTVTYRVSDSTLSAANHAKQRRDRIDKGEIQFPDYHYGVLQWIGETEAVTFSMLQRLLTRGRLDKLLSEVKTSRTLRRYVDDRLVKRRRKNGQVWIWLTKHGLKEVGLPYREQEPLWAQLEHTRILGELRFYFENTFGDRLTEVLSDRELKRQNGRLPPTDPARLHIPDMLVTVDGQVRALNYQRSRKTLDEVTTRVMYLFEVYRGGWVVGETDEIVKMYQQSTLGLEPYFDIRHIREFPFYSA